MAWDFHDALRDLLDFDPLTGVFTWKPRTTGNSARSWNSKHAGRAAGTLVAKGYRSIRIFYKPYLAHRLAWFYVHGVWPSDHIDHMDGNRDNNAIANLRPATNAQNLWNRGPQKNNTTGIKGVSRVPNGWFAQIKVHGKQINLGVHATLQEAASAYSAAATKLHGDFANTGRMS